MRSILNCRVLIAMFPLLFGCSFSDAYPTPDVKLVGEVTKSTAKKLQEKKKLYFIGRGSQMMHNIEMLAMSFYFYQEVDLKTARELVVTAVNEYSSEVNNNKEIRPYLHDYPFTAKNVEIRIWIYKPDGSHPPSNKIQYISAIKGILTYYTSPDKYSSETIHEETYEEALQLASHEIDSQY